MLLTGWIPQGLALSDNPYISGDVDSLDPDAIVGWPPAESAMQGLPAQPLARHLPVSAPQQRVDRSSDGAASGLGAIDYR